MAIIGDFKLLFWLILEVYERGVILLCAILIKIVHINPPTYKQSHTPTVIQGRGVDGTPPWVFLTLQYFEKISPLVESL